MIKWFYGAKIRNVWVNHFFCVPLHSFCNFIEQKNKQKVFKSGGGITVFSDAAAEYQELIDKIYVPITIARNDSDGKR